MSNGRLQFCNKILVQLHLIVSVWPCATNFFTKLGLCDQAHVSWVLFTTCPLHPVVDKEKKAVMVARRVNYRSRNVKKSWVRVVPLFLLFSISAIGAVTLGDILSFELLSSKRELLLNYRDAHYIATVFFYMTLYTGIVAFSLPGATVATLTGGFLFGIFPGVLLSVSAATMGATFIFLAARWGFGDRLAMKMDAAGGKVKAIKTGIDENQWSMLFLVRLVPLVPFFVANLVPALVNVKLWRYVISTFLGIIPGGLVYTSVGAGLGEVFAQGKTPNLRVIFEPQILLPILGLCGLAALPMLIKAIRGGEAL